MARGHRPKNTDFHCSGGGPPRRLSGLFRTVSAVEPSLSRPLPTPSPSLIGHLASVDVKHHDSGNNVPHWQKQRLSVDLYLDESPDRTRTHTVTHTHTHTAARPTLRLIGGGGGGGRTMIDELMRREMSKSSQWWDSAKNCHWPCTCCCRILYHYIRWQRSASPFFLFFFSFFFLSSFFVLNKPAFQTVTGLLRQVLHRPSWVLPCWLNLIVLANDVACIMLHMLHVSNTDLNKRARARHTLTGAYYLKLYLIHATFPSLISLMVSVDVKHHVYLHATQGSRRDQKIKRS